MKRAFTLLLGLIISGGALYYLLRGDIEGIQNTISGGRYEYLIPGTVVYFAALVTRGYRWRILLGDRTNTWHAFNIMNVGYLLNNLPLRIGELARAWLTTRLDPPIKFLTAFSSIVVERVLDVLAVVLLLAFSLTLLDVPNEVQASGAIIGIVAIIAITLMIYFAHHRHLPHQMLRWFNAKLPFLQRFNLVDFLDHALDGVEPLTSSKVRTQAILLTAISWALSALSSYIFMLVFFDTVLLTGVFLSIVMLALAIAIPSVPGNLGTFEAAGVAGIYLAGMIASTEAPENAPAVAYSLMLHAYSLGGYVILGILGLWAEQTDLSQVMASVQQKETVKEAA